MPLPDCVMTPIPNDVVIAANYEGIDVNGDPEVVIWGMRKMLEMQRQMVLPENIGGIGGYGPLTTIFADRIEMRILQRCAEDQIGAPLRPAPIDWIASHRANPKPKARNKLRMVR